MFRFKTLFFKICSLPSRRFSHNSMDTSSKNFPLLHCFSCGKNSRGKFALIVTNSDLNSRCSKVTSFMEQMWVESQFHSSTITAKEFVDGMLNKQIMPNNANPHNFPHTSNNEKFDFCDLSTALQHTIQAIQNGVLHVGDILIASNKSFSVPKLFDYMQAMYASHEILSKHDISISGVFGHSYTCILPSGHSELQVCSGHEGDYCGLIPLGQPVTLTTNGLVWNLNNQKLQFNLLVSSSNQLDGSNKVSIKSDGTVMWTMGISCEKCVKS